VLRFVGERRVFNDGRARMPVVVLFLLRGTCFSWTSLLLISLLLLEEEEEGVGVGVVVVEVEEEEEEEEEEDDEADEEVDVEVGEDAEEDDCGTVVDPGCDVLQ